MTHSVILRLIGFSMVFVLFAMISPAYSAEQQSSSFASGMECTSDNKYEVIEDTPVIFTGKMVSSTTLDDSQIVTFQILTNWKGDFAKGDMANVKLVPLQPISPLEEEAYYVVYAEYDPLSEEPSKKHLVQSSCQDSINPLDGNNLSDVMYMLKNNMASQDPPAVLEVYVEFRKSLGYEIGDVMEIYAKISDQKHPREITLVFESIQNNFHHEEIVTTDSQGIATLQYIIPKDAKPGHYRVNGHTTNDVIHIQRGMKYVVNEPGPCDPGMYKNEGVCKKPEDYCPESGPGMDCSFDYTYGLCSCVSTDDCLIATASYGSELAPQVQMLREIRDNTLLSTYSGSLFMSGFNSIYYSFSPTIAQWENENPPFKEAVKLFITPMISALSIMTLVDEGSEVQVILYGVSTIGLIVGIYFVAPVVFVWKVRKRK